MKKKISVSWSGGKDSAFALYKILTADEFQVVSLHTVFNAETRRVGMHGVHESLIEEQAASFKLPLEKLFLDASEDHAAYTDLIRRYYHKCKASGVEGIVFGDIFLEDLKTFRDKLLQEAGLAGYYPLWRIDSKILIHDFINLGFKTMICSANASFFSKSRMGETIDANFINTLPSTVDACGENGEFHTFVFNGPIFHHPLKILKGEVVERKYSFRILDQNGKEVLQETPFWFQDITPS